MSPKESSHSPGAQHDSLRVFVSATSKDLTKHREALLAAIRRVDWHPVAMEDFGARPKEPVDACLGDVATCQALVVLVAYRYGCIPTEADGGDGAKSITWLEVEAAKEKGVPIFAFVVAPDHGWDGEREEAGLLTANTDDEVLAVGHRVRALQAFRTFLEREAGVVLETFTTPDNLASKVATSLARWREEQRAGSLPDGEKRSPELTNDTQRYLACAVEEHKDLALAGFDKKLRVPVQLEDMHVPLHASIDQRALGLTEFGSADEMARHHERSSAIPLIDAFRRAAELNHGRGLVILGDPGAGKTTHLKRLLLHAAQGGSAELRLPTPLVPVFLPLRDLRNLNAGLDELLQRQLEDNPHLKQRVSQGFADALLKEGRLLFLLDGLDEIPDVDDRQGAVEWIEKALESYSDSRFAVTCRYAGYRALEEQFSGRFLELHIRHLNAEQAERFIRNWFRVVETNLGQPKSIADEKADELLTRLKEPDFRAARVFEMTRNPLLLTAICLVHRDRGQLPHRRADLYEECVNVLLEGWRRKIGLDLDAKKAKRLLQPVAYWLHGEEGRTRATGDELAPIVDEALQQIGDEDQSGRAFLASVRDRSGLLTGWGEDSYGFLHLGFQEYLAARHIAHRYLDRPELLSELGRRFGETWWREVTLLLLALENPPLFRPLMEEALKHPEVAEYGGLMQACLEDALEVSLTPFLDVARLPAGEDKRVWARQAAAARVLRTEAPEELERLRSHLKDHPLSSIREPFKTPTRAATSTVRADQGGYELVRIPGGTFLMGSTEEEQRKWAAGDANQQRWFRTESPRHEVAVPSFYLGRCPVTNEEYGLFLKANPQAEAPEHWGDRELNQPSQPVVGVSWQGVQAYRKWAGLVLPSEAQWEYACRAGKDTAFSAGSEEPDLDRMGWYSGNSGHRLHPVAEKPANAFGLHDMHGNVWEWCQDTWHGNYEGAPADGSARGSSTGRAVRGGSFIDVPRFARSACRIFRLESLPTPYLGFRLAGVITE
ncbi:MAG: SUMF1/EgtB/PvdO family nonheme iron enzyme [Planctomycetota bacterium]